METARERLINWLLEGGGEVGIHELADGPNGSMKFQLLASLKRNWVELSSKVAGVRIGKRAKASLLAEEKKS